MLTGVGVVAGTSIGAGVLVLPLAFAGLSATVIISLMLLTWFVAYFTALVSLELNLQNKKGCTLRGLVGQHSVIMGRFADLCFKGLCYALLCAYMGSCVETTKSILQQMSFEVSDPALIGSVFLFMAMLFFMRFSMLGALNQLFFVGVVVILGGVILLLSCKLAGMSAFSGLCVRGKTAFSTLPILFTSFGFQVVFHTLMDFYKGNAATLRRVFLWGTLVPLVVYVLWTLGALLLLAKNEGLLYKSMVKEAVDLGGLMAGLARAAGWGGAGRHGQIALLVLSWFAVVTSLVGVGVGLISAWEKNMPYQWEGLRRRIIAAVVTLVPVLVVFLYFPHWFMRFLSIAGAVLVMIAIILPLYVLRKHMGQKGGGHRYYPIVYKGSFQLASLVFGVLVILAEMIF